jgi:hypothetical protein
MQRPSRGYSGLDQVRIRQGIEACGGVFREIYDRDNRRAVMLLNDRRLTFPTLYILSPQIEESVYPYLKERLIIGLRLIERVRSAQSGNAQRGKAEHTALTWILDTGYTENGLDEAYEEVMERTVSLLINTYHDTGILSRVADMIFARHREGRNIHDLTWAYFQSGHPDAMRLIARRLSSADPSDIELVCRLLHIDDPGSDPDRCWKEYQPYMQWLRDNGPYLYFTGESMQYASAPIFYRVDPEREYLQKGNASYHRKPITPADEEERRRLEAFAALPEEEKTSLAEYSHRFHAKNAAGWKRWMRRPIEEQIRTAKAEGEGSV